MEVSFLGLVFFVYSSIKPFKTESVILYYLVQRYARALLIGTGIIIYSLHRNNNYFILFLILIMVSIKLGLFPFYFWVIPVIKDQEYISVFTILGPIKVSPLVIIRDILIVKTYLDVIILIRVIASLSILVGSFLGLNSSNILIVIGASSITHTA
jgi:NADH:ubiquinone oxidoreductase subunit 2 (subunit N)